MSSSSATWEGSVDQVDLLVKGAELVVTMSPDRAEIPGGWVAIESGLVKSLGGPTDAPPLARAELDARGCLVTPGLVNTHHHLYQNLTRAYRPATTASLFDWLRTLYPLWGRLDEEGAYLSAWVGLAELALGGCTTSTDHLYVHPRGHGDLVGAEIAAARDLGMRFHPTRGSMSLSEKDGGLPPDEVVEDDEEILADSERLVKAFHDPSHGAMVKVALAPCSPFSVTPRLMQQTAELAERLDVRLHTHLAEDPEEDLYSQSTFAKRTVEHFEELGWMSSRTWVAHCIYPNEAEISRLGAAGVGVAHCPSSNMMIGGGGLAPVAELRLAGSPVGIGCDGSASTDHASLWLETKMAMLTARLRGGPTAMGAREALEMATAGSAACLGRQGELGLLAPGAVGDLVCWSLEGLAFAGALSDPVEAWLRCGPTQARHTVVAGRLVVRDGQLVAPRWETVLAGHARKAAEMQGSGG